MEYTIVRSKRKTASIYVKASGVEVKAPLRMSKRSIDEFVASNEKWILKASAEMIERAARRSRFELAVGSMVLYRGREYPISEWKRDDTAFDGQRFLISSKMHPEQIRSSFAEIYRKLAKQDLTAKTLEVAKRMRIDAPIVKISGAKTRWGSYNVRKQTRSRSINYSWRLIMADDAAIEYVVVHELAHTLEQNHSGRFWAIVAGELPDYKERIAKLHMLQERLNDESWLGE